MNENPRLRAVLALAASVAAHAATASPEPSPCFAGNVGEGASCLYLVMEGNAYDTIGGHRSAVAPAGSVITVDLWQDFRPDQTSGGGLNLLWNVPDAIDSLVFAYDSVFLSQTFGGGDLGDLGPSTYTNFGWANFNGWGGEDQGAIGTDPGFQLVGSFTVQLAAGFTGDVVFNLEEVMSNPQNSNFVDEFGADMVVNAYDLRVMAVAMTDSDDDGVADDSDNCVNVANADQRDTNGDGIGNACDADFNDDCIVDFDDLNIIKLAFFDLGDLDTDIDGDGETGFTDLNTLKLSFFEAPGPSGIANDCTT